MNNILKYNNNPMIYWQYYLFLLRKWAQSVIVVLLQINSMLLNCIQTLLGQRDLSTTGEYTHVSIEQLKQVHNATHLGKGGSLQFIII